VTANKRDTVSTTVEFIVGEDSRDPQPSKDEQNITRWFSLVLNNPNEDEVARIISTLRRCVTISPLAAPSSPE